MPGVMLERFRLERFWFRSFMPLVHSRVGLMAGGVIGDRRWRDIWNGRAAWMGAGTSLYPLQRNRRTSMSQTMTDEPLDPPDQVAPELGALPTWDLSDLYPGQDSDALKADLDRMEKASKDFYKSYNGKLANLKGAALGSAIAQYEEIDEIL